jgi:hypothetical protein
VVNGEVVEPTAGIGFYSVGCGGYEGSVWIEIA